jgi:hypothetical protein
MKQLAIVGLLVVALAACSSSKSSDTTATAAPGGAMMHAGNSMSRSAMGASSANKPNCGAVQPVWVNLRSHVYHVAGSEYYGKTKYGEYLCPAQAKAQGFHRAGSSEGGQTGSETSPQ